MFVRRLAGTGFFIVCFIFFISSRLLAQESQGNVMIAPAAVENKTEASTAVTPEAATQAPETAAPAVAPAAAQTTAQPAADEGKAQGNPATAPTEEKKTEWVWGEVVSVDQANKQIIIKHLDYESYEEVQTTLKVNEKTLFENVTDLSGVKAGDHITVDYIMEGANNIADLIVVEKGETAPEAASGKEKSAEGPQAQGAPAESAPQAAANMTAAPEAPAAATPEAVTPPAANQAAVVNATEKPAQ
jgi:hypothetical protein